MMGDSSDEDCLPMMGDSSDEDCFVSKYGSDAPPAGAASGARVLAGGAGAGGVGAGAGAVVARPAPRRRPRESDRPLARALPGVRLPAAARKDRGQTGKARTRRESALRASLRKVRSIAECSYVSFDATPYHPFPALLLSSVSQSCTASI